MASSLAKTHANYSHDWWTPPVWKRWVQETFGQQLYFDPCPGNWGPDQPNGLSIPWAGPCYVNHPGARGSTDAWWMKYQLEAPRKFIWCAFSVEQFRHMYPSALELPGWLVAPRERIAFIWGGPDQPAEKNKAERKHGEPMKSPGNWTAFWTTVEPACPPVDSIIMRTGKR